MHNSSASTNDKNLNSEIETKIGFLVRVGDALPMIRISILRLKLDHSQR